MKKILGIISSLALMSSASASAYFGINLDNRTTNEFISKFEENGVSLLMIQKLNDIFDEEKIVNDEDLPVDNEAKSFSSDKALENVYYNIDLDMLDINIEGLIENGANNELIEIFTSNEFLSELNAAYRNGYFVVENNVVEYLPYLEEKYEINFNLEEDKNEIILEEVLRESASGSIYTRWYWFGTYKATLNNAATKILVNVLRDGANVSKILSWITKFIPKAGPIISQILKLIAAFLKINYFMFYSADKGSGVYFWATVLTVWYVKSL